MLLLALLLRRALRAARIERDPVMRALILAIAADLLAEACLQNLLNAVYHATVLILILSLAVARAGRPADPARTGPDGRSRGSLGHQRREAAMNVAQGNIFELGLPRRGANHRALTPLDFLSWSAAVFPDRAGVVYGRQVLSWGEVERRCRRLASALRGLGVDRGDTVAVLCPNTPPMLEAHYGVPMAGAVLNALNFRLDAASLAFILEHGEAKVLLTDSEWAPVIKAALAQVQRRITVIDIVDAAAPGELLGVMDYEALLEPGRSCLRLGAAGRRVGRDLALLHLGHHRQPQGRGLPSSRRFPECHGQRAHVRAEPPVRSICGRCRCSTATAGPTPGRSPPSAAPMSACARSTRR